MKRKIDYTIGDEIVCVRTHSQGIVKEGQIFTCLGLKKSPCQKCASYLVNIGIKSSNKIGEVFTHCSNLHQYDKPTIDDGNWWFNVTLFRSLQKIDISEALEVLQEEPFKVK